MKQVEVQIMGQGYILGCPDGGEPLLKAAVDSVDREMTAIRDGGKVKARERIAVLAALNLAYRIAELPPPLPPAAAADSGTGLSPEDIDAWVRRLDAVLGSDGHLI